MKLSIAIVGAGLSGLTIANVIGDHAKVTVFEKARGVGGRMSTRYSDEFYFDNGAQFFTARDKHFKQFLAPHCSSGLVQEWQGKVVTLEKSKKMTDRIWFEPHYVATPGMNNLCKKLAENIKINLNCEIAPLGDKSKQGWELFDKNGSALGYFDWVISTAPTVQTSRLFAKFLPQDSIIKQSKFLACYSLMFGFHKKWNHSWIAANILNSPLEWIAVNSTKPGRNHNLTTLVVHSSNKWAEAHVDDDLEKTEYFLRDELQQILKFDTSNPEYFSLHRWRYALLDKLTGDTIKNEPYYDKVLQLASVGDWCSRSRIEDTWINSNKLALKIVDDLTRQHP
jgi:predicted NAD/FAD-dependent oxidoreductase